jgi:hypothetical protein
MGQRYEKLMEAWLDSTSLAISESYRITGKNARYDLMIATSQFFSKVGG